MELVHKILDAVEHLLSDHGVMIPDPNRTGDPEEACLFGDAYYRLEDEIKGVLGKEAANQVTLKTAFSLFEIEDDIWIIDQTTGSTRCYPSKEMCGKEYDPSMTIVKKIELDSSGEWVFHVEQLKIGGVGK